MTNFEIANKFTSKWEVVRGITKYGVDIAMLTDISKTKKWQSMLQSIGIKLPITPDTIKNLTKEQADKIYYYIIWDNYKLDNIPLKPAILIFDAAVDCGISRSVKFAQLGYNDCNPSSAQLTVDGIIGKKTIEAMKQEYKDDVLASIIMFRKRYMEYIVTTNPSQSKFFKGWINKCNDLENYVKSLE